MDDQPRETTSAYDTPIDPTSPERFINRELSWLAFNERVLEEAMNRENPLLERIRFLSISASNWDEFFMVRVAGLKGQVAASVNSVSADGRTPGQALSDVLARGGALIVEQQRVWNSLKDELRDAGVILTDSQNLDAADRRWLEKQFLNEVWPLLTPIAVDPGTAFPFIPNLGFCLILQLKRGSTIDHALLPIPKQVARFHRLPGDPIRFIALEDLIELHLDRLFPRSTIIKTGLFRVVRDSAMVFDERAEDLVRTFEAALKQRRYGSAIRLSINADIDPYLHHLLASELEVEPEDVFFRDGLLGLADVKQLIVDDRPDLLFTPYEPRYPERVSDHAGNVLAAIRDKDFIVHHPYESFDVVVEFVSQAARDPAVVAIKQTLYRTSSNSPIVSALIEAAEAGKQVTAVVELKARFDEEANIRWAKELEGAGAHVVYGFVNMKIHAKMSLVVRREGGTLRAYAHFGTGNYHPITAKIYTDLSFFTTDVALCRDAAKTFNFMTGYDAPNDLEKLAISPISIRQRLMELIDAEAESARAGRPSGIWIKSNSLIDNKLIDALYRASQAGVPICCVVRGICGLRPGVPGLSDTIQITSIVGRYLEHSRIYAFGSGQALPSPTAKVFISSADWMQRNMDRRVETMVPIENETVHRQVLDEIMVHSLDDTCQSWRLHADGSYTRIPSGDTLRSAHTYFMTNPSLSGRGSAVRKLSR